MAGCYKKIFLPGLDTMQAKQSTPRDNVNIFLGKKRKKHRIGKRRCDGRIG
jgi:hypothetical protein